MDFSTLKALTIPEGDVVKIECNGSVLWSFVEETKYINQVPISIDTDKSIYNGKGYNDGYRLSSSGEISSRSNATVTGFIPVKGGDVIRIKGYPWHSTTGSMNYLNVYNSSFGFLYAGNSGGSYSSSTIYKSIAQDGDITVITLKEVSNIAYFRLSYYGTGDNITDVTGANLIITVNEEIV